MENVELFTILRSSHQEDSEQNSLFLSLKGEPGMVFAGLKCEFSPEIYPQRD